MAKKDFTKNITSGIDSLLQSTAKQERQEREFVKYNYIIEKNTHRQLKMQSVIEERPIIDILQDALNLYFESKGVKE